METKSKKLKIISSKEAHKERHIILHKMLDELVADFIQDTGNLPSQTSILKLMQWSYEQIK